MKVLCVAEKPSIAKSVAQLVSGGNVQTSGTGHMYVKNYSFSHTFNGQPCQVVMTALLGHIMETDFPQEYKNWQSMPPMSLFEANIVKSVKKDFRPIERNLQEHARTSQILMIWTDCDREGENIGAEVVQICRTVNPRLLVKRARFSVIQRRELLQAWDNLIELDMRQAAAVDARSELDLRVGAAFTRFQTLQLSSQFGELDKKVLSYGLCQFPTLGFVVDRYNKILRFRPESFWKINVMIERENARASFDWARGSLFDKHLTLALYETCVEAGTAEVVRVTRKPKSKWPPLPLTTVELQKAGSRLLHLSSDRTMQAAEKLYQQGLISYPRTETDVFADNFHLHPLIEAQCGHPAWGGYAQRLLEGRFRKPRRGNHDDQAHPPIHPVKMTAELSGDELKIYEFVTRRFLACCSEGAQGNETVVTVAIASEEFVAKGSSVTEANYLEVYPYDRWSEHTIPNFIEGEQIIPAQILMESGQTTAPELISEADLIGIMEKSGIGTDATIHEHIKKILSREYAVKEGQYFRPTILGTALVSAYDEMDLELSLAKPFLRSMMEANMRKICDGTRSKNEVVQESVNMYRDAFMAVLQQTQRLKEVRQFVFSRTWIVFLKPLRL
ncbi:DNA topoisomerase [Phlyctochytrium arcticum]|nr:DNA topoisomerase [Phlyctochytrium arcticum]